MQLKKRKQFQHTEYMTKESELFLLDEEKDRFAHSHSLLLVLDVDLLLIADKHGGEYSADRAALLDCPCRGQEWACCQDAPWANLTPPSPAEGWPVMSVRSRLSSCSSRSHSGFS